MSNFHAETAISGDAERVIMDNGNIFNLTAFDRFDFTTPVGPGDYLVEIVNGQQKFPASHFPPGEAPPNGYVGFGSAGGGYIINIFLSQGILPSPGGPVPEPSSLAILALGLAGLIFRPTQNTLPNIQDIDHLLPKNSPTNFFSQKKPIRILLKSRKTPFKITFQPPGF